MNRYAALPLLVALAGATTGCVPVLIGGGAYAVSKATSERGLGGTASDTQIQTSINKKWWDADADIMKRLDLVVQEGRVLITGQARDEMQKVKASELAWEVPGVTEVVNEAVAEGSTTFGDGAKDTWISTQIRTLLTVDTDIAGRNYTIQTFHGVVYLTGYARSQVELDRVTNHASNVSGVQKVVSYVRVGDQVAPTASAPTSAPDYGVPNASPAPMGGPVELAPAN